MFENFRTFETDFAGRPLVIETGKMAQLANGECLVRYGETVVHVAVTASAKPREGVDFFPLSVDFEEKLYAVGKIPGSFLKREGRPSDKAILTSRVIDRPIRPLFPKDMRNDVSVVCTVMSVDHDCQPEIAAMVGTSIALTISDIPWNGPISGVSVGMIDGEYIINPTAEQREKSRMAVTVASTDERIAMIASQGHIVPTHDLIKNADQIAGIKESCKINIAVLDYIEKHIHEGMNTAEIDKIVYDMTTEMGGIPAPLNYEGYPYSVCTSVNDQVCHGFPSKDVILKSGDIINVDVSTILNGYFSDSSRMFCIGDVSPEKKRLVEVTKECVELGLKEVKPWGFLGDMGQAVHDHAFANGYTVVREIGGHGVGLEFHEEPWVGYNTKRGQEMLLVPGMIFTIEPMVNMGKVDIYVDSKNDWEVYTEDGLPSAQWEIMVLVTEDGHEVLCW